MFETYPAHAWHFRDTCKENWVSLDSRRSAVFSSRKAIEESSSLEKEDTTTAVHTWFQILVHQLRSKTQPSLFAAPVLTVEDSLLCRTAAGVAKDELPSCSSSLPASMLFQLCPSILLWPTRKRLLCCLPLFHLDTLLALETCHCGPQFLSFGVIDFALEYST